MNPAHLLALVLTAAAMGAGIGVAIGFVAVAIHRRIGGPPPTS